MQLPRRAPPVADLVLVRRMLRTSLNHALSGSHLHSMSSFKFHISAELSSESSAEATLCQSHSSTSSASSRFFRVLAPRFSTERRFSSSLSSMFFEHSSFWSVVAQRLTCKTATPNHAMQLTGSARHGSCSPQTRHGSYRAALRL